MGIPVTFQNKKPSVSGNPSYPKDFTQITVHPLNPLDVLDTEIKVSEADLVSANLEVGYGKWDELANISTLSEDEVQELMEHLRNRASWLCSGLKFDNGAVSYKSFKTSTESSDKGTESYYFGMMFGYFAFRAWLPAGVTIRRMLHVGVFSKGALINTGSKVTYKQVGEKSPDLLCEDSNLNWHFVEAKGGETNYRCKSVRKALKQLDGISNIHDEASGRGAAAPHSCICSFVQTYSTQAKPDPAWKMWIVDPSPRKKSTLVFNADLAELRLVYVQDRLLRSMPWSLRKPLSRQVSFKQSALKNVIIRPMNDDAELAGLGRGLARLDRISELLMDPRDQSMKPSLTEPTLSILSDRVRSNLGTDDADELIRRLRADRTWQREPNRTARKAYVVRALYEMMGFQEWLYAIRRRRESFYFQTRDEFEQNPRHRNVVLRQLSSGSIVVGLPPSRVTPRHRRDA